MASGKRVDVGERIRSLRTAKGLGLIELAEKCELSKGYLSALETGNEANPSLEVLRRIARHLDVTVADLLGTPKVRGRLELPSEIPEGLKEYLAELKKRDIVLDTATIVWMANAKFRGGGAPTKEDFAILHRAVNRRD